MSLEAASTGPLQLWGGLECTVNRVRDVFYDQLQRSGHLRREVDLELIRGLGLRKLRYALHWERYERTGNWDLFDRQLREMQRLGIEPIAGLVHHGSGPAHTSLVDPEFPARLAAYALEVAQRYPWIRDYTPVNEPHTTARFSALYGHWYPHHRSISSYLRALLNQITATVLAMRAIRTVRPDARLIHTEDAGRIYSTPQLEDIRIQREHRRWLGTDLLCGRMDDRHPLFAYLLEHGIARDEALWFAANPCPPDVVGLNYYLTSDRFLDHRTDLYPQGYAGGDLGDELLVDVEALRVHPAGLTGAGAILLEAWQRYGIPVAITEAHLGSTPEDQVRWLAEFWNQALAAREAGADVVAVTVWALLGSFDWCHLVTRDTGIYEPGVFDVSDPTRAPAPTELARVVRQLAMGEAPDHPALSTQGWWNSPDRIHFPLSEQDYPTDAKTPRLTRAQRS